jgi:flagellar motor switch protein FliG
MPPDDDEAPAPKKPMSLAEALKEGVKGASGQITDISQLDGPSKCAVVLLTVGAELGSEVLRLLSPFEVQKLSSRMAVVRSLSRDIIVAVLREFKDTTSNNASVAFDTDNFMASILNKALGADGASDLLGRLEAAMDMSGVIQDGSTKSDRLRREIVLTANQQSMYQKFLIPLQILGVTLILAVIAGSLLPVESSSFVLVILVIGFAFTLYFSLANNRNHK